MGSAVGVELEGEVDLVDRVVGDVVAQDAVLVDYAQEVHSHFDLRELPEKEALHGMGGSE